jgi:hypothetical protein
MGKNYIFSLYYVCFFVCYYIFCIIFYSIIVYIMYSFYQGKMKFGALQPVVQRTSTQINNAAAEPAAEPAAAPAAEPAAAPAAEPAAEPAAAPAATPYKAAKAVPRDTRHSVNIERSKPFPEDKRAKTEIKTNSIGDPLPVGPRLIKVGQSQHQQQGPGVPIMNIARVNRKSN